MPKAVDKSMNNRGKPHPVWCGVVCLKIGHSQAHPLSPKLCKIAAILRRRTVENQNQSLLTYKELSMDVDGFHVYQGGNEVVLTSKEFALLRLMLENQGKVFTRQMLLDRLWADDLEVEDRIVDSHIKNIRKKLNADYIKTIRGVGYRIDKEN